MTGTHQDQLIDHLRVLLFFIELNILLYMMISRHRRQQNPAHAQPASPSPPPPPRRRKSEVPPSQEVNHQLQEATGSRIETGSYFETLIPRGKLQFTAIPMEGWKNDHLQICPPGLQSHFERISTRMFDVFH